MTPPAARQPGEGAAHRISERDILWALQYGPERLAERKPLELWDYELPGVVAWINSLLAAAEAASRRDTIAEVVMLLDREASTRFDQFLSYELASSDGAAALRDAVQKVRALIPGEGVQR